jgi:hypothetical protein
VACSPLTGALAPVAAVCFLLHYPEPCGRSALPTTLSYGARTFLSQSKTGSGRPARSETFLNHIAIASKRIDAL